MGKLGKGVAALCLSFAAAYILVPREFLTWLSVLATPLIPKPSSLTSVLPWFALWCFAFWASVKAKRENIQLLLLLVLPMVLNVDLILHGLHSVRVGGAFSQFGEVGFWRFLLALSVMAAYLAGSQDVCSYEIGEPVRVSGFKLWSYSLLALLGIISLYGFVWAVLLFFKPEIGNISWTVGRCAGLACAYTLSSLADAFFPFISVVGAEPIAAPVPLAYFAALTFAACTIGGVARWLRPALDTHVYVCGLELRGLRLSRLMRLKASRVKHVKGKISKHRKALNTTHAAGVPSVERMGVASNHIKGENKGKRVPDYWLGQEVGSAEEYLRKVKERLPKKGVKRWLFMLQHDLNVARKYGDLERALALEQAINALKAEVEAERSGEMEGHTVVRSEALSKPSESEKLDVEERPEQRPPPLNFFSSDDWELVREAANRRGLVALYYGSSKWNTDGGKYEFFTITEDLAARLLKGGIVTAEEKRMIARLIQSGEVEVSEGGVIYAKVKSEDLASEIEWQLKRIEAIRNEEYWRIASRKPDYLC